MPTGYTAKVETGEPPSTSPPKSEHNMKVHRAYTESVLRVLRQRNDLEEEDTSQDLEFQQMHPSLALREVFAWHLGDALWASDVLGWFITCGYEVTLKEDTDE